MRVRRIDPDDRWNDDDGRAAIMVGQRVVVLSSLAALLHDLMGSEARHPEWLTEALVQTVGPAPEGIDPRAWVEEACSDLQKLGLIMNVSDE